MDHKFGVEQHEGDEPGREKVTPPPLPPPTPPPLINGAAPLIAWPSLGESRQEGMGKGGSGRVR